MNQCPRILFAHCLAIAAVSLFSGADWPQFRGPGGRSVSDETDVPVEWSTQENIAWQADLPGRGASSPIVVDGNLIVTCSSGYRGNRLHVLCFDVTTGQQRWQRRFWATGRTLCHPSSSVAAPTPASDGESIFAFFSSNDLICLDLDGNLKWYRGLTHEYPTAANDVGMAASPVVAADTVIVQVENEGDSFAAGIDTATGSSRWRVARAARMNWCSPVVRYGGPGEDVVLLQSSDRLTALDVLTGQQRWEYGGRCATIASPVVESGIIYAAAGGLTALAAPGGDSTPDVVWESGRLSPGTSSPVVHDGRVYTLNSAGGLTCGDAATGNLVWRLRLDGSFWATPVLVGDRLYCVNRDGLVQVVQTGGRGEVIAKNDFGEPISASPAVADGALYFRSDAHLWKVARP